RVVEVGRPFHNLLAPVHPIVAVNLAVPQHFSLSGVPKGVAGLGQLGMEWSRAQEATSSAPLAAVTVVRRVTRSGGRRASRHRFAGFSAGTGCSQLGNSFA
ncbi:MAG TPA: hypothetical protein VNH18_32875, partial [Bryobacteraceae bacterium]|nr:hypothetical protein [Bryobacteraceae bacterium]